MFAWRNKSFNNVVWTRVPKTVFVGHDTLPIGALDAVLAFNEGNPGRVKVLQAVGIDPGWNAMKIFQDIHNMRIVKAKVKQETEFKEGRLLQRNDKRSREDEDDDPEPEFGSGLHRRKNFSEKQYYQSYKVEGSYINWAGQGNVS